MGNRTRLPMLFFTSDFQTDADVCLCLHACTKSVYHSALKNCNGDWIVGATWNSPLAPKLRRPSSASAQLHITSGWLSFCMVINRRRHSQGGHSLHPDRASAVIQTSDRSPGHGGIAGCRTNWGRVDQSLFRSDFNSMPDSGGIVFVAWSRTRTKSSLALALTALANAHSCFMDRSRRKLMHLYAA